MCEPISMTILGAATAYSQYQGQKQQAKAQAQVQANASKVEQQRYLNEVSSMRMQQAQEQVAMAQRIQAATKKARETRATARVSAGEAGVAGLSVDALMNSLTQQEAQYNLSETQNQQMTNVNRELVLRDAGIGFTNNMLRINKPIEQPDFFGSLLTGAQTGLSMYSMGKDAGIKNPFTKS